MISNAHFWNAGARSYNPICLNPLLVLDKISPLPGSSVSTHIFYKENLPYKSRFSNCKLLHNKTSKTKMNIYSEGPFSPFPP